MSLKGKHVLLTGASGGIGSIVARYLMADGALVTGIGRSGAADGVDMPMLQADLARFDGIAAATAQISAMPCDILVNLAGMQHFGPVEAQTPEHTFASYMLNLVAPVMLAQAVLPRMKERGQGHIVNIGSIFGSIGFAHFATYSSAKAGMKGFSDALRREVRELGIDVTYVAPRGVDAAFNGPKVKEFARLTRMKMDDAHWVADCIVEAIEAREKTVYLGMPEGFFVRVNALLPGLVDMALSANDRKARTLFQPTA